MEEKGRRGRPRKVEGEVVEGRALVVAETPKTIVVESRDDRREATREQRKRVRMVRRAERAVIGMGLMVGAAVEFTKKLEAAEGATSPFGQDGRRTKLAKQALEKAQAAGLQILDELPGKLMEDLW